MSKTLGFNSIDLNISNIDGQIMIGEDADPIFKNEISKTSIPIYFKHLDKTIFIEIENDLPFLFPLIFLNGTCPKLNGKTIREKSQDLLLRFPETRIGRLGCDITLLLYDQIIRREISMNERLHQMEHQQLPKNSNRKFSELPQTDPASNAYWQHRKNEAEAMTYYFGNPHLMITFTFGNNWPECIEIQQLIRKKMNLNIKDVDFRFLPYETMVIFEEKMKIIRQKGWNTLIQSIGIDADVIHYCWRVEFQARGAPHVHSLIWLNRSLSLNEVEKIQQVSMPLQSPWLSNFVKSTMIHKCNINRCKRGDKLNDYRFGFPKKECKETGYNEFGRLQYKRTKDEASIVEFCPILCFLWRAHCHINILKTNETPITSSEAASYVLKYNLKSEPSFTTEINNHTINARYISAEEAMYRIFSKEMCSKDVKVIYQSIQPPTKRMALYNIKTEKQIQFNGIEKYYHRPKALENLSFLEFYSYFDIVSVKENEVEDFNQITEVYNYNLSIPPPNKFKANESYDFLDKVNTFRMGFCMSDPLHPEYKFLKVIRRKNPAIVITNKMSRSVNKNDFYFHWLFINSHWRNDEEILANRTNYHESAIYHGLSDPIEDDSNETTFLKDFLKEMSTDARYSPIDIVRICYDISKQEINFDPIIIINSSNASNERKEIINKIYKQYIDDQNSLDHNVQDHSQPLSDEAKRLINCFYTSDEREFFRIQQIDIENKLNEQQKLIYNETIQSLLAHNGVNSYHYVSGKAGTGKSFLIKSIQSWCIGNNKSFITSASTGIAASLINGTTFHSAFQIFENNDEVYSNLRISSERGQAISQVDLIIVDEITMLRKKTIEVVNNKLNSMRKIKFNDNSIDLPFGGKTVLFLGDPAQVPAVTKAKTDFDEARQQFFNAQMFSNHFKKHKLFKSMRTNEGENRLIKILDDVRNGTLTNESIDILKSCFRPNLTIREIDKFLGYDNKDSLAIFYKNNEVNDYNYEVIKIRKCQYRLNEYEADALFFEDFPPMFLANNSHLNNMENQRKIYIRTIADQNRINIFKSLVAKKVINCQVPFRIHLIKGARVMLLKNIDINSKIINGVRGTVSDIISDNGIVRCIFVKFDTQRYNESSIPITRTIVSQGNVLSHRITVKQFPLRLSWAVTAHKAQGQTLTKVAISLNSKCLAHGAFYVALSRVRKLDDILLFGNEFPQNGINFHTNEEINSMISFIDEEIDIS